MVRIAIHNVLAHKRRLLSMSLAVLLGVAFLCGTLIFSDTITKSFDDLISTVNSGTDAYVRSSTAIPAGVMGGPNDKERPRIDGRLIDTIRKVDGVAAVDASLTSRDATILDKRGQELGSGGHDAPSLGSNWVSDPGLNAFRLASGHAPTTSGDVVIDRATANKAGFHVGDAVTILVPDAHQFRITGIATFRNHDGPGGATYALFTLPAAQQLFGKPGMVDAITARAVPGTSQRELTARIQKALSPGLETITGAAITKEQQDGFQRRIGGLTRFFSIFGYIAIIVGGFVIYNTFSIIVAQRTREMALLRAVGASRNQVLASVLVETLTIGVVASLVGVAVGVGVGAGLRVLFGAAGFSFPAGGLVLRPATVIAGVTVGTLVTIFAGLAPAIRASRVPPLAALREIEVDTSGTARGRAIGGVIVSALGLFQVAIGISSKSVVPIGIGAMLTLIGMVVLGPVIARPVSNMLGRPAASLKGVTGTLARRNAARNPRRTSGTASALMVGIAVVTVFTAIAASIKATTDDQINKSFVGDMTVASAAHGGSGGFSPELTSTLSRLPEVDAATPLRRTQVEIQGAGALVLASDPAALPHVLALTVSSGRLQDLGSHQVAVSDKKANTNGWKIGDHVAVSYAETGQQDLTIAAVYKATPVLSDYLVSTTVDNANSARPLDDQIFVKLRSGVDFATGKAAVKLATTSYPTAKVQDTHDLKVSYSNAINSFLFVIYGMLALSILIASIGISNTLQLSVFERIREVGLLRAVGATRGQIRGLVRWESGIIATFGTLGGVLLGGSFGWAIVRGLGRDQRIVFRLPVGQAAVIVAVGALVGVLAALRPASNAGKLDVLRAIGAE